MAWELMNEPRCSGDFSGSKLQHWIDRTAEFLKSVDPNHMVTVGTEGFFGSSTPGKPPLDVLLCRALVAALQQHYCRSPYVPTAACERSCLMRKAVVSGSCCKAARHVRNKKRVLIPGPDQMSPERI